jgi:hypothetical protein
LFIIHYQVFYQVEEFKFFQVLNAPSESAHTGQHNSLRFFDYFLFSCYNNIPAKPSEGVCHASQIAHAVINNRYHSLPVPVYK